MQSPQFKKKTHRAQEILQATSKQYKLFFDGAEASRIAETPESFLYCNVGQVIDYVAKNGNASHLKLLRNLQGANEGTYLLNAIMLSAWRQTQGIYRFDSDIYNAVADTDELKSVPVELLKRLPEWAVYIETPDFLGCMSETEYPLHGFFATIMNRTNGRYSLLICFDVAPNEPRHLMPCYEFGLNYQTVRESLIKTFDFFGGKLLNVDKSVETISRCLNLILFLCMDNKDLMHKGKEQIPANPTPKKTKKGWRMFPADTVKVWDVGVRMGSIIRQANDSAKHYDASSEAGETRQVRPHFRRAHWHTIRSGKRKDENGNKIPLEKQHLELKWFPPSLINADMATDEMPAVIHRVKG